MSETTNGNGKSLVTKLAEVMALVHRVPKRGRNTFHGYDYATEADIAEAIRKELADRNVMLIPAVKSYERVPVGDKGSVLTTLEMEFTFIDGDNPTDEIRRPWFGAGTDKEDKGLYKAITGGEKYFLLKTFLVSTGDDPEKDDQKADGANRSSRSASQRPTGPDIRAPRDEIGRPDRVTPPATDAEVDKAFEGAMDRPLTVDARELWKQGKRDCPSCGGKGTLRKGAKQYGGGVYCDKEQGCGYNWRDNWKPEPQAEPSSRGEVARSVHIGESASGGEGRTDAPPREHLIAMCRQTVKALGMTTRELQALREAYTGGKMLDDATDEQLERLYMFLGDGAAVEQFRADLARGAA
jgi:hypothetical protein